MFDNFRQQLSPGEFSSSIIILHILKNFTNIDIILHIPQVLHPVDKLLLQAHGNFRPKLLRSNSVQSSSILSSSGKSLYSSSGGVKETVAADFIGSFSSSSVEKSRFSSTSANVRRFFEGKFIRFKLYTISILKVQG